MKIEQSNKFKPYKICIEDGKEHQDLHRLITYALEHLVTVNSRNTIGYNEIERFKNLIVGTQHD